MEIESFDPEFLMGKIDEVLAIPLEKRSSVHFTELFDQISESLTDLSRWPLEKASKFAIKFRALILACMAFPPENGVHVVCQKPLVLFKPLLDELLEKKMFVPNKGAE